MTRSRWIIVGVVVAALVVLGGGIGWTVARNQALADEDHGWEECEAPRVATVPDVESLGDDPWPAGPLSVVPFADIDRGTSLVEAADGSLLVTEQLGRLHRLVDGEVTVHMDLTDQVSEGQERGLLDIELDPERGWAYLTLTNGDGDLELRAYDLDGSGLPDPATERVLMTVEEPHEWHNGGDVEVGPDGNLWLSVGDGGHIADPFRHGQDPGTPLGTILRIVPTEDGYEIPEGNPFDGRDGDERVVAYGFRNPWRIHFGPEGRLWVAEVGQYCAEEVDVVDPADLGGNYGWSNLEGTYRFIGRLPDDPVWPAFEYTHDQGGCAIVGGGFYQGSAIPELVGSYVYADYCRGRVMALDVEGGTVTDVHRLGPRLPLLGSIGSDADGELYLLTLEEGIHKLVP